MAGIFSVVTHFVLIRISNTYLTIKSLLKSFQTHITFLTLDKEIFDLWSRDVAGKKGKNNKKINQTNKWDSVLPATETNNFFFYHFYHESWETKTFNPEFYSENLLINVISTFYFDCELSMKKISFYNNYLDFPF